MVPFKQSKTDSETLQPESPSDFEVAEDDFIEHCNQPLKMEVFPDPVTEKKKLIIVYALPGGATNGDFILVGSGPGTNMARITYTWPKVMYDIDALFAKTIAAKPEEKYHPKITALKEGLKKNRESKGEAPIGVVNLNLPIPVLTAEETIIRKGGQIKENGTVLLIVELTAFESLYTAVKPPIVFEEL